MTDEVYTQTFVYNDGTKYKHEGMHNYHIQLCALMTMSFLFELELFSVVHNYIPINIDNATKNWLPSTYAHSKHNTTTPLRQYKKLITNGLDEMLKYFTGSLDTFFNNFMNQLLVKIQVSTAIISQQEILEAIVPINSETPPHVNDTFDYIYVDWKGRIKEKIKNKLKTGYSDADDKTYSICINAAIKDALDEVESGGSTYIAEGTGFFSFLYLLAATPDVVYNGSCITYSMLELYIMARLHVHANNLILEMESEHPNMEHQYWKSVQTDENIKLPSVTHWTTQYNFQSYPLHFRNAFTNSIIPSTLQHSFNFVDPDKPKLCLLLLYPIFDSYIRYIDQPDTKKESKQESAHIDKILQFIRKRIELVKTLFRRKTTSIPVAERVKKTIPKSGPDTIPATWFTNVFGFEENAANFATTHKDSFHVKKNPKPPESEHILMTVKNKEIDIGVFRYRSVEELLKVASDNPSAMSVFGFDSTTNLKYLTMTSPAHTVHMNPSYSGSIFQVASQFNALEMAGPTLTPQQGITIYYNDNTQGPVCAMVCPFGTLYRNYFCMPDTGGNQPEDKSVHNNPQTGTAAGGNKQINTLTELMKIDDCFKDLRFQNGYIFVKDNAQLDNINNYLLIPENFWKAMMAIKYVIQEDTPVVDLSDGKILDHNVSQIYCSAYPVAYSTDPPTMPPGSKSGVPGTSVKEYELLSSMILHAVYYSTLAYAVSRITPDEPRKKVFLTKVGGGAFGNDVNIIDNAIYNAVSHFTAYPIDVYIVEYKDPDTIVDPEVKPLTSDPSPYKDIQAALEKRAKDETEKVKKATDEMVTKIKKETELRSSLKKSIGEKAKLEEKAKKKEEDKVADEKKHLNLTQAIDEAITTFSKKLKEAGSDDNKKYAEILVELMTAINKDRDVRAKELEKSGKKTETAGNDTDSILKGKPGVTTSGARSLANMGQTCYMNAALQLIYSMTKLKGSTNIPELEAYLTRMASGVTSSDAQTLAQNLYILAQRNGFASGRSFNKQEDSSELLVALFGIDTFNKTLVNFTTIDSVHTTTTPDPNKAACRKQTGVDTHTQYANMPDSIKDTIIYIPPASTHQLLQIYNLPIGSSGSDFNSMVQKVTPMDMKAVAVTDFLKSDKTCSAINKGTISTQTVIIPSTTQRYFIVSLNRFNDAGDKIKTPIKLTDAEITLGTTKFGIKGCISHHGDTPKGGHYTYVEFKNGKPVMVYDDSNITPYDSYVTHVGGRTVDTEGYVLLFEREPK